MSTHGSLFRWEQHLKTCPKCAASKGPGPDSLCEIGKPLYRKARKALIAK